jgi:hypothetical protein
VKILAALLLLGLSSCAFQAVHTRPQVSAYQGALSGATMGFGPKARNVSFDQIQP